MLNDFGKFIRKQRIDMNITLKKMADDLGVTSAFLSGMETGRKQITEQAINGIKGILNLQGEALKDFQKAVDLSRQSFSVQPKNVSDRLLVAAFARQFNDFDERKKNELKKILEDE